MAHAPRKDKRNLIIACKGLDIRRRVAARSVATNAMTDTSQKSRHRPLFYALVLFAGYLTYLILGPFLVALAWAAMFAVLFHRMQVAISAKIGPNRAALVTTLLAGIVIVAPAVMLVSALAQEAPQATSYLRDTSRSAPRQIARVWGAVKAKSPVALPDDPTELLTEGARRALRFLAPRAGAVLADFFRTLGSLVAMLFALFFFLRDGDTMSRELRDLLPLREEEADRLIRETHDLVIASVGAGLVVAAVQGTIGGLAFWLLGLGAPVFWGVVMAFCSLLPVVGAALVWVPTGLGLLLSGEIWRGVTMLLVGALGISMADNILRPLLLSGRTAVNGLVIFFGLLGGVAAFGFIGLVVGPIILVTTGTLLKMLRPDLVDAPH
jgi:predicted PurR-regulated permease PerM